MDKELHILIESGLSEEQALVYESLLSRGPQKASILSSWTGIKRGLIYKVLDELEALGLVDKKGGTGTVATFSPNHPSLLLENLERKEKELALTKDIVGSSLGIFTSKYNLLSGKPNVQFYEGDEGIKKAMDDSLKSKTPILQFIDNDSIVPFLQNENEHYVKKRHEIGIQKLMIVPDDEYSRKIIETKKDDITNIKILDGLMPFSTTIMIYDNKVVYLTARTNKKMAVLIEDPDIYEMHKNIFEALWQKV